MTDPRVILNVTMDPMLQDVTPCAERHELEQRVVTAVKALYDAKGNERIKARAVEREVVGELDAHIKEHGCKQSVLLKL